MDTVTLPDQIKAARARLSLSQKQAAVAWGVSLKSVKNWEQGARMPQGLALAALQRVLDAVEVRENLSTEVDILPSNEAQARPLVSLPPDQQREAWDDAIQATNGSPTGKDVAAAVETPASPPEPSPLFPTMRERLAWRQTTPDWRECETRWNVPPLAYPTGAPCPDSEPEELARHFGRIVLGDDGLPTEGWKRTFLARCYLPFSMYPAWAPDCRVAKVWVHATLAQRLQRALAAVFEFCERDVQVVHAAGLDRFGGAYAYHRNPGTSTLSPHAYGAAFDFCLPDDAGMPPEVVAAFAAEGWSWGGHDGMEPDPGRFEAVTRA